MFSNHFLTPEQHAHIRSLGQFEKVQLSKIFRSSTLKINYLIASTFLQPRKILDFLFAKKTSEWAPVFLLELEKLGFNNELVAKVRKKADDLEKTRGESERTNLSGRVMFNLILILLVCTYLKYMFTHVHLHVYTCTRTSIHIQKLPHTCTSTYSALVECLHVYVDRKLRISIQCNYTQLQKMFNLGDVIDEMLCKRCLTTEQHGVLRNCDNEDKVCVKNRTL